MTTPITFHNGPPPIECGWMLTRVGNARKGLWRWWDGECWSSFALPTDRPCVAAVAARVKHSPLAHIQWSLYYPPNARVPEHEARIFKEGFVR